MRLLQHLHDLIELKLAALCRGVPCGRICPAGLSDTEADCNRRDELCRSSPRRPEELRAGLKSAGLTLIGTTGLVYDPLADEWSLSRDTDVNYFATAMRG